MSIQGVFHCIFLRCGFLQRIWPEFVKFGSIRGQDSKIAVTKLAGAKSPTFYPTVLRKLFWPKVESAAFSGAQLEDRAEI